VGYIVIWAIIYSIIKNTENPHKHWAFEDLKVLVAVFWQHLKMIHK